MFLNKVQDQKVELLRAVFRNMYLKEKCDYLDSECKMLAEHLLSSQVTTEQNNESKQGLDSKLNELKALQDQKLQELHVANQKIKSMSLVLENSKLSLSESKSMNEVLEVKNEMIQCLQEELVKVRLEVAEKWALIRELRQTRDELQKDKEVLTKTKPETIARLQQDLMTAKILETQYSVEFAKIKTELEKIKTELLAHKEVCKHMKSEGKIKLFKKGAKWMTDDETKEDVNEIENVIKELEKEKLYLQNKIPELQSKIDILNKHIKFKEEQRCKLQEKFDSMNIKYQSVQSITLERQRQCEHLENSATEKVDAIRNSSREKKQNIDVLSSKLNDISNKSEIITTSQVMKNELTTIQALEEQIWTLEQKIKNLNIENKILSEMSDFSDENKNEDFLY